MSDCKHTEPVLTDADKGGAVNPFYIDGEPKYALLPGDPNRISVMAKQWDEGAKEYDLQRGYRAAAGTFKGASISAFSTGVGGPTTEHVLTHIAELGVHTVIRVGTTGCIQEGINIGDIIINDANVRMDGTSNLYVRPEYPSAASFEVTMALIQAAENLGFKYHVGTGYTAGSFYAGQFRPSYGNYRPSFLEDGFSDAQKWGVTNFEMEGSAIFTLSRIFGIRAGMCASVVANRLTGEWDETPQGETNSCLIGAEALRILQEWDELKKKADKKYFFPGLIK